MVVTADSNGNRKYNRHNDLNHTFSSDHNKNSFQNSVYDEEDEYCTQHKSKKNSDSKGRNYLPEDIEMSDKLENIKRFEREKKAAQKKNRDDYDEKRRKPVLKQKRSTKDWTRDYHYGLLDD